MDSGVEVRVLRPPRPPVECTSVVTMSNLIELYGGGNLRDSKWSLLQYEDNLPAGQYTYICGLEPHLVSALRKVQVPLKLRDPNRRGLMDAIYAMYAMYPDDPELLEFVLFLAKADEAWLNGLMAVIGEDYSTNALPALIDYGSSTASAARVEYPATVATVLVEAWRRPFEDPLGGVDYLLGELEKNVDLWKRDTAYHAAWTVLLQSSGWGKSRTVCELHTKGVHVVYVSFMSTGSSGYPPGSPVSGLVSSDGNDPRFVAAWIFSILPELVGTSPREWMKLQMEETSAKELEQRVRKRYAELREQVRLVPHIIPREGEEWDSSHLRAWVEKRTRELPLGKMKVLIHLDEAATFFRRVPGSFLATRRFFSCIMRGSWIFGLVSDTAGELGLVFPQKMYDPSARAKGLETKFFKAVWVVGTLWGDGNQLLRLMNSAEDLTIPSLQVTRELFKWGRPLWRSTVEGAGSGAGSGAGFLDDVVTFAIQKLLGGMTLSALQKNAARMTTGMGMAILGVAVGLEVVAWSDLAKDMVANHMRTVSYIAGERDLLYSADAVEPILGEAAARILVDNLRLVLKVAEGVFKQGYVVEGPRGEFVGRLVMVLAMHALCSKRESLSCNVYSHPVQLQDFLTTLCGQDVQAEGLVCFNRFIMLNRQKITRQHLLICFICCMAIIPCHGQKAFDAMVPVLLPGPGMKYELRADRMVGLPVQIRNRICTSVDSKPLATSAREFYFGGAKHDIADEEEDDSASSHSKDPKKMSVVEEDEDDEDEDPKDPDLIPEESDSENEKRRKRSRILQQQNLGLPLGIYMHLGGRKKSTEQGPELEDDTGEAAKEDTKNVGVQRQKQSGSRRAQARHKSTASLENETAKPKQGKSSSGDVEPEQGKSSTRDVQNAKVLILHGLNYSFLKVEDLKSLQQLRSAFFKLDDHLQGKEGILMRHNLSNYLMPMNFEELVTKQDSVAKSIFCTQKDEC